MAHVYPVPLTVPFAHPIPETIVLIAIQDSIFLNYPI